MLTKEMNGYLQAMTVCHINGKVLHSSSFANSIASSPTACLRKCMGHADCPSANYHAASSTCTLNDKLDLDSPVDLKPDAEYLYLATRVCN